jgi:hypothetical protein
VAKEEEFFVAVCNDLISAEFFTRVWGRERTFSNRSWTPNQVWSDVWRGYASWYARTLCQPNLLVVILVPNQVGNDGKDCPNDSS